MDRIESLLRKEIGLDAASIGSSVIERTVRLRMKTLGLQEPGAYAQLLKTSRTHLDELVEAVVVTETWFFRDRDPFNAFLQLALNRVRGVRTVVSGAKCQVSGKEPDPSHLTPRTSADPSHLTPSPLRILSVPCSSGEEPYSLAMTLLDAGWSPSPPSPPLSACGITSATTGPSSRAAIPQAEVRSRGEGGGLEGGEGHDRIAPDRFVIDAVDISTHALARAQQAVYRKNSFRGEDLAYRDRHFVRTAEGFELNGRVRECVRFHRANLLGETFLEGQARYDIILCRNLLIYFDRATQVRALGKLHELLTAEGVLFVGPAEMPLVTDNGFVNAHVPMAFACRKTEQGAKSAVSPSPAPCSLPPAFHAPAGPIAPGRRQAEVQTRDPLPEAAQLRKGAVRTAPPGATELEAARQLADAGKLEEAVAICEAHLRQEGPSTQAYYLLGLLRDASGDPQAIAYYRKALYLDPNHYETLLQISLLLEKTGDSAGARMFKRRAQRSTGGFAEGEGESDGRRSNSQAKQQKL